MTPLVSISNISKLYKMDGVVFQALENVSLSIQKGDYLAIMGPSGSGKSTLMHIIGCLDRPTAGQVFIEGRDIGKANDRELAEIRNTHIGFVFQQFNLLRRTTALANVELPLIYARVSPHERRERAKKMLTEVGLSDKMTNLPSQLSGGQQQRVAIARALVTNPSVILADEPTGNLDSKSGQDIMKLFKDLNRKGRTIVVVTHEKNVTRGAKHIIRLADGKIVSHSDEAKRL